MDETTKLHHNPWTFPLADFVSAWGDFQCTAASKAQLCSPSGLSVFQLLQKHPDKLTAGSVPSYKRWQQLQKELSDGTSETAECLGRGAGSAQDSCPPVKLDQKAAGSGSETHPHSPAPRKEQNCTQSISPLPLGTRNANTGSKTF